MQQFNIPFYSIVLATKNGEDCGKTIMVTGHWVINYRILITLWSFTVTGFTMVFCNHKKDQTCRWRRRKEARPEEILDAALELFSEKGFSATRMIDIAKKAGISKGTLYLYFENKEAVFRAVVLEMIAPQIAKEEEFLEGFQGPTEELLRQMIHSWWANIGETKLSAIPKLIVSEAGNFPELAEFFVNNVVKRARNLYSQVISRGIVRGEFAPNDPDALARLVLAPLVQLLIWMHSLKPFDDDVNIKEYIDLHIGFILTALKKPSAE